MVSPTLIDERPRPDELAPQPSESANDPADRPHLAEASEDEDMRAGVASMVLEHLLEHHLDAYFPRLKERIEAGSPLLVDTLAAAGRSARPSRVGWKSKSC